MMIQSNTNSRWTACLTRLAGLRLQSGSELGQSLIEFALTLPALLLVVTGILSFGVVLYDNIALSEATQAATRQLVIGRGQVTDPCATVYSAVTHYASNLNSSTMTFTVTLNGTNYTGTTCTSAAANMVLGVQAQVHVTYPAKLAIYGDVINPGFTLNAQEQDKIQ